MLNKVILMGRLCADPDFRQTQSGIAVCRIRVAIDRPYTSKSTGERQADFINVVCWRQQAEFVSRYFHKGSMIIVEGRLQNADYTDGNGVKHYSMDVQADNVTFGETRAAAQANGNYTAPSNQSGYQYQPQYQQQCNVSCSLDCCGQLPLMICTSASNSSRQNLCPFCHALSQLCDVLVINDIYSVYAEHADLFSRSFSAHSWCSFHGQILLTAFCKFRFCFLQF